MTYTPPPFPTGLRPGGSKPSAKGLQKALIDAGYVSRLALVLTDTYGPVSQGGVKRFHRANPDFGGPNDVAIGPKGWAELHREAYGGGVSGIPEPVADYHRVTYDGKTVNVRTMLLLQRAEARFGARFYLVQGSYHTGVAASAGTHDGGGCVDISVSDWSTATRNKALKALRQAGFAAWLRTPAEGFSYHIHACAIGDSEMASIARQQVQAYFNGRNGLAGNGPDSAPSSVGRPWPSWANKFNQ